jgi:hypothetical protein
MSEFFRLWRSAEQDHAVQNLQGIAFQFAMSEMIQ